MVYVMGMIFTFGVSFVNGLEDLGIHLGFIADVVARLPFNNTGFGWILAAVAGSLIGLLPFWKLNNVK